MIDPIAMAAKIAGTTEPSQSAVRSARLALAACWDEAVAHLPPKLRDADAPNPYRRDNDDIAQPADRDQLATAKADDPRGVWIIWRTQGVRSDGFTAIYPQDAEIDALRIVNADGYGHAEFVEYGI